MIDTRMPTYYVIDDLPVPKVIAGPVSENLDLAAEIAKKLSLMGRPGHRLVVVMGVGAYRDGAPVGRDGVTARERLPGPSCAWCEGPVDEAGLCAACYGPGGAKVTPLFMLHPGLAPTIRPYWELLLDRAEPTYGRLARGEIRKAGVVLAVTRDGGGMPPAWMPGRFLAWLPVDPRGGEGTDWAELAAGNVEVDLERGLAACPLWLRERYRRIAEETARWR